MTETLTKIATVHADWYSRILMLLLEFSGIWFLLDMSGSILQYREPAGEPRIKRKKIRPHIIQNLMYKTKKALLR